MRAEALVFYDGDKLSQIATTFGNHLLALERHVINFKGDMSESGPLPPDTAHRPE